MAAGTLYTYPENFRAYKIQIAAKYSGADVKVVQDPPAFKLGETNKSPDFLKKFPLGKVPAFEGNNGTLLTEANAIAFYVANETLRGSNVQDQAQVQMFVNLADNEILPSACNWVFPTLGIMQFNKQNTERAKEELKNVMFYLNEYLTTRTFLVGERVTLADIAVACNLLMLYQKVFDPSFRQPYGNVTRWFVTVVNQPEIVAVIGKVSLCEKMAQFDAKKFAEISGGGKKADQKKERKDKKQEKPPKEKKAKKEEPEDDDSDIVPPKADKKDPFAHLPKSTLVFDEWKKMFSNNDASVYMRWFWENAEFEGYSIWHGDYDYNSELKMTFMASNLVTGMFQRVDKLAKNAFASVCVTGENNNCQISGVWMFRGQELAFNLNDNWNIDSPSYTWKKLDMTQQANKDMVTEYFSSDRGDMVGGKIIKDIKILK
ncbi:elongation factor 1-gamma-like [Antedon mediterranea]|uniref:elongation factor 1-gamma-like n=1 Tax=Antedon mediterranea TaxID=105859 RepID=UPI003AF72C41